MENKIRFPITIDVRERERERELTVGNYARKKVEKMILIRARLLPPKITMTFKEEGTIWRRLATTPSTLYFFAHIIYQNHIKQKKKN